MQNVGDVLESHKGVGPGFDFLRIWLAMSVLWFHSFVIVGSMNQLETTPWWYYIYSVMPMFFALSGFLIAGSADRLSLGNFLINRRLRIVPALAVEIIISAIIIGPLFTRFALSEYLTNIQFWHYFTNIFGWIQYQLPGVFLGHPSAGVINQSLWTVPFEVGCYALISGVIVFRLGRRPSLVLLFAAALLILPVLFQLSGMVGRDGKTDYALLNYALFSRGSLLFPSFLLGACFYWFRFKIPFSGAIAAVCGICCMVLAVAGNATWRDYYALNLASVVLLVYLTVYIGCCPFRKIPFYSRGDYSYGIYLYGYPLQQCLLSLIPSMTYWLIHFLASLLLATGAATFSWHFIEKPILKLRKHFSFTAPRLLNQED
jgi:peptidoglycan/LPS O-acetylase OafA/YrhL